MILMTSPADTEEMYQRLKQALGELDYETEKTHTESGGIVCGLDRSQPVVLPVPRVMMTPANAMEQPMETLMFSDCAGRISGEFLYLYPPGVPVAAPGEELTEEIIKILECYEENGLEINGPAEAGKLRVLKRRAGSDE